MAHYKQTEDWARRLMAGQRSYTPFSPRLGQSVGSTPTAPKHLTGKGMDGKMEMRLNFSRSQEVENKC